MHEIFNIKQLKSYPALTAFSGPNFHYPWLWIGLVKTLLLGLLKSYQNPTGKKKKTDSKRKQEIRNMSLEHFTVPGSKEVLNI